MWLGYARLVSLSVYLVHRWLRDAGHGQALYARAFQLEWVETETASFWHSKLEFSSSAGNRKFSLVT